MGQFEPETKLQEVSKSIAIPAVSIKVQSFPNTKVLVTAIQQIKQNSEGNDLERLLSILHEARVFVDE